MFGKTNKYVYDDKIDTVIGAKTTLEGNLTSEGTVRVDGIITGDVKAEGCVYIGESALIKGNVSATDVHLSGTVEGNVHASGLLKLQSTARLYGNIKAQSLVVDEGSIFQGSCDMIGDKTISMIEKHAKNSSKSQRKGSVLDDVYKEKEREKLETNS
ncbi:MAG TPA: polymer-forming cytoskeletal protein [Clostridiaceae bacterium]|jgi:cytoskeletal protein CcmA (bactofilin family)|nr:polymer-forming cytoskeletal protein [Clostridiaceae bacterium]